MLHNAAFHQGLHCMLRQNQSSEKEIQYSFKIIIFEPSICPMLHPDFIACSFMENSIVLKRVNGLSKPSLFQTYLDREHSGSVVECLTLDRGAKGSGLTGGTVLCP